MRILEKECDSMPILMQGSYWWWKCSDMYMLIVLVGALHVYIVFRLMYVSCERSGR